MEELRRQLTALEAAAAGKCGVLLALGNPAIDGALGGGLGCGALHEIAAVREADVAAASGFALALAVRRAARRGGPIGNSWDARNDARVPSTVLWIADGGSAALPRRRDGDRRNAPARHRSGGDAAACARRRRRQRARPDPVQRAGRDAFRRRHALEHRRGSRCRAMSQLRSATLPRASSSQPSWPSRNMDRGVEQCGAAFRARNAF